MKRSLAFIFALAMLARGASAEEISIAAASDLTFVFQELIANYEKESGNTVKLSLGSSGNFFSQIQNGAPFDIFFSADINYPKQLQQAGLAEPGMLYPYAAGKIVLWVPAGSKLDVSRGLSLLADPAVRKIAIANPRHAPYGRAAVAVLQHDQVYEKIVAKLVYGENISQAEHFVESGNAEVGILALSLVVAPAVKDKGRWWGIPASSYPAIEQAAVILKASAHKKTAKQFVDFLKRPESVQLLKNYGFAMPEQK